MNIKPTERKKKKKKKSPNQRASIRPTTTTNLAIPTNEPSRTQHPPASSEIPIEKATLLWPDFGIEKTDNDIGVVIRIRPETALVPKAEKLRRRSGVKLATAGLEHDED